MSDQGNVRPMRPADYSRGRPVVGFPPGQTAPPPDPAQPPPQGAPATAQPPARRRGPDPLALSVHPMRDLVVGAVVGAVTLWAVPKMLESAWARFSGGPEEYPYDEFEDD